MAKGSVTKYPVLLLHGLNCRDKRPFAYFGRIPGWMEGRGVHVYLGGQDATGTIRDNALFLQRRIYAILEKEGCEKINIIAHSKGGLEARYLISTLHMAPYVASLTTLATPHQGSWTARRWCYRKPVMWIYGKCSDWLWKRMGDEKPNVEKAIQELTPAYLKTFNRKNPDSPLVYYQSYGAELNGRGEDLLMSFFRHFVYGADGENDGLIAPKNTHWGVYRGTIENISHQDLVDSRQKDVGEFHMAEFYGKLIEELAGMGF